MEEIEISQWLFEGTLSSDAARRWAGWALAHLEFGSLVNPITTREADYTHHITASPPKFENPAASLVCNTQYWYYICRSQPGGQIMPTKY